MDNKGKIIGGVMLLLLGIGLMLEVTHVIDFNFKGWWTAFIIVPCLINFFNSHNKTMSLIGVGTGVLLLLAARDIIMWEEFWRYLVCVVFIIWGIMLIFSRNSTPAASKKHVEELKQINQEGRSIRQINTSFGKQSYDFFGQRFEGAKVQTSFGFVGIDLRGADLLDGAVIDIECSFGGMEIRVDDDVLVKQAVEATFAGVDFKEHLRSLEGAKTLYVKGECTFGGIEIK